MVLSAKKGNLVLNMTCEVYFTNPTNVSWDITRIDIDPARILGTQRTNDVTIGIPTETIITRTVAPGGVGEFKLDFPGVLSSSNLLKTGWDLKDLAGYKVPVQVNFTVYDNGHPYVVTSNGNILGLGYTATQHVEIMINEKTVTEHIIGDIVSGVVVGLISARAGAKIGAIIGTAVELGAGTVAGTVVGGIVSGVLGFIAGFTMHEKLGLP